MISPLGRGATPGGGAAPAQNQSIALRVAVIGAVLLVLFGIVFFRLWYLQVLSGNSLAAAAAKNRGRSVAIVAPRGEIVDRNGAILVGNRRAQIIELSPGTLPTQEHTVANLYGQQLQKWHDALVAKYTAKRVAEWKTIPASVTQQYPRPTITPLNDPDLLRSYAESGTPEGPRQLQQRYERLAMVLKTSASEIRRRVITSLYLLPYADIPLTKQGTNTAVVDYIAENADMFPGVSTTYKAVRSYPNHKAAAQIFGQVGAVPVNDSGPDKGKAVYTKYRKLNLNSQVGLNGLELEYDGYLRGKDGQVKTTIDSTGNVVGTPTTTQPTGGDNLQLTIDLNLQKEAEKQLKGGSTFNPGGLPGAIVAMDPTNGEILASQSNPSFDPNELVRGISDKKFQAFLNEDGGKPLFNRVTNSGYAAGSTFKPVTAFAGVSDGKVTPSYLYNDTGTVDLGDGTKRQNAAKAVFGQVDLQKALAESVDTYFYRLGGALNVLPGQPQVLQQWARRLGYGHATGVDLPGESAGTVPDRKWRADLAKAEHKCRQKVGVPDGEAYTNLALSKNCGYTDMRPWSLGDNVGLAVGQGDLQVTPLQSAVMYAAIENGGKIVTPHFAKALQDRSGALRQTFPWPSKRKVDLASTGALSAIRAGLYDAVNQPYGTSYGVFKNWPKNKYPIFGKTGTAQKNGHQDQSWYAAYVPDDKHPIVIVATVEDGGYGAATAAPIVGEMLKTWFKLPNVQIVKGDDTSL